MYRYSHYEDKKVMKLSYIDNGIPYIGKTASLFWDSTQGPVSISDKMSYRKNSWSLKAVRSVV